MYLFRRESVYYYRRPILQEHFGLWLGPTGKPRKEWSRSLRTKDRRTAIDRMPAAAAMYQAELDKRLATAVQTANSDHRSAPSDPSLLPFATQEQFEAHMRFEAEEAWRREEEAKNDPLWEQREALRREAARLRDERSNRELLKELKAEDAAKRAVSFMDLFADWAADNGKPDTIAAYRTYARAFEQHVGKSDANAITEDDVADWRNALREKGGLSGKKLTAKTINGAYMCAINAIFEHARGQTRRLKANPAKDLKALRPDRKPKLREKSITDEEAILILADTMEPGSDRLLAQKQSAKRWCPWLMAYTGARVLEVAQLRKEDVGEAHGVAFIHITPEAGKNKTETARKVPLHPHLIEQGFLAFVAQQPDGPLFYDPLRGRKGRPASQAKKVGQYLCQRVRALGVTVPQPNHGWRHRMETMNNRHDLRDKNVRMILGHSAPDSNGTYGDHELPAMLREIEKLPAYQGPGLPSFKGCADELS